MSGATRAKDAGPARPRLAILEGIRPYDRRWLPRDVLAGVTLAALGDPRGDGLHEDLRDAGDHRALHAPPADGRLRDPRLVAHLVVGGDSATAAILAAGIGGSRASPASHPGQPGVARPRRPERPDVRRAPAGRPAARPRVPRGLHLADRARRLPHRRRDPGRARAGRRDARRARADGIARRSGAGRSPQVLGHARRASARRTA